MLLLKLITIYNSKCKHNYEKIWHGEFKVLNEQSEDEYGEWIEFGH